MFNTACEIIDACAKKSCHIYDLVLEDQVKNLKSTEDKIKSHLREVLDVMEKSSIRGLDEGFETRFKTVNSFAKKAYEYQRDKEPISGKFITKAMAMALSTSETNAKMGLVVAAPTAGSSGIMPAMLMALKEKYNLTEDDLINGLLTSVAIGQIIGKYATFAGAEGGCQAECGSASAMAAAAGVEMLGGSPEEALNAASISIINVMGLACDPIAGLVEYPCVFRNASGVVNAILSCDLAMSGVKSIVPFDEVVVAMGEVGKLMHESIRETGLGGLAGTKTGKKIRAEFLNLKDE
ncbi:L-serine ammonia-lyase, iron-sulfur-dependent, subunit alpha [Peptoniphilus sp. GNH]|nr:L-serine dehydratase, iron-sulfur-dependent, alpha subunit [Clostridiales bacterium KA00134]UHR02835.1 L-serine ammonia-lyase, iron-sulfur-dependent, subunit alpha [Peptoniphilus sp. GNH]